MKILLAGPILTEGLRAGTGLALSGVPEGYAQTPLVPLAAEFLRRGHEVHIITLDPSLLRVEDHQEAGLRLSFCPLRAPPRYRARVRALDLFKKEIACLVQLMTASNASIIHAHWTYEFAEAAVRSGKPHLVTMHDLGWDVLRQFRDPYRAARLIMKYRVMRKVENLSVVAPFMAPKARQYGYSGHVEVIPNSIILPDRFPHVAMDAPIFATIGNTGRLKNVGASVTAFEAIRTALPGAQLHLFGEGLDEKFASGPEIHAHGNIAHPELMRFLEDKATVLIHPSRTESFGVIIAEAKARGVPVIAGAQSGGAAYVAGRKGGILVDIEDPSAIARAAIELVSNADRLRQMAADAVDDVRERFDVRIVADQYFALYERIIDRGPFG